MSINNSPVLNTNCGLSEFRFWCQKVLPLAYDDSLSYYETLCKIANKLNEAITSANTSQENIVLLKQAYDELLEYINDYTKTLDETVVNSVNEKINNMAESGELFDYVVSRITAADVGAVPAGYVSEKLSFTDYASALAHIKTVYASMNNNEKKCLFVDISDGNVCDGEFPSGAYFVEIYRELDNYGIVEFINSAYVKIIVRIDGTWGDFCYENPPMSMGVEYRTAKRHNGSVVYAKCVNLRTLPNTGDAQPYLASEVRRVLSLDLIAVRPDGKSNFFAELDIAWNLYWHTGGDDLSLLISTKSDDSDRTGYAIMEYTKV